MPRNEEQTYDQRHDSDSTSCDRQTGYCLAETGASYIVFAPEGGKISLDLSAASGNFTAEWVDPVVGTRSPAGQALGGARQSYSASSDAAVVLFLKRSSQP